jgi:hypothetical protein
VQDFLDQVEIAANEGRLYYLALAGALTIPDMCAALESKDGETAGPKFIAWFDKNFAHRHVTNKGETILTGAQCYGYRCSFLHQGRMQHRQSGDRRLFFFEPGDSPISWHMNIWGDLLNIDVQKFGNDILDSPTCE